MDSTSSPAIRALITEHIRSVIDLECLLLLSRDAQRGWTAIELADELRIGTDGAQRQLEDLARRGFAAAGDSAPARYSYVAPSPAIQEVVAQLSAYYAEHRVSVIEMIYARPEASPLKSFADAFRIRKEPPSG